MTQLQLEEEHQKTFEFNEDTDLLDTLLPRFFTGSSIHIPKRMYAKDPDAKTRQGETLCGRKGTLFPATFGDYMDKGKNVSLQLCNRCADTASEILGFDVREYLEEQQRKAQQEEGEGQ